MGGQEQWLGQEITGLGCPEGHGTAGELCYQRGEQSTAPCHGHRHALPTRSLRAGSAGRGMDRQGGQVSDPRLFPSPTFHKNTPVKHISVKARPSSCLWGTQPSLWVLGQKKQPENVSFSTGLQLCTSHNGRLGPAGVGRDLCWIMCF